MGMKIVYSKIIPFPGFKAMNLFGILFIREEWKEDVEKYPEKWQVTFNHESIHTEQMKETLFIGFYTWYFFAWLVRLLTPPWKTAYRDIAFEQEAYYNEKNLNYLKVRKPYNWLEYCFKSYSKARMFS